MLCVIYEGDNGTNGCHLADFSEDVAFACHLEATGPPRILPPCKRTSDIGYARIKIYASDKILKWQAIQLDVHSIVGEETSYR